MDIICQIGIGATPVRPPGLMVHRAAEDLERFVRELSPIARKVTPWLREVGLGIQHIKLCYHGVGAALSRRYAMG